jgi:two-component system sensor histidine kinase KdpD
MESWSCVCDHVPGLPNGEEARVFEKFHCVRSEEAQSGFGLGLSICKYIVEEHGGSIEASHPAGGGAKFRFSLPLDDAWAGSA